MKTTVCSLAILVCLSACNNGGSGSSGPAKSPEQILQEASSAKDLSATIVPNSFSVIKSKLSEAEKKEMYTIGCKTPGISYPSLNEVDQGLKLNQVFNTERASDKILGENFFSVSDESTVAEITNNKILTKSNFIHFESNYFPFTDINQIFSKTPHFTNEITKTVNASGDSSISYNTLTSNLSSAAQEYIQSHPSINNTYFTCNMDYDKKYISSSTTDKISYQFNGQNITAYLTKYINEGEIVCAKYNDTNGQQNEKPIFKVSMGQGLRENITISTNQVVQLGFSNCGGSEIYRVSKTVLDSGKILESYVEKTLVAPLR